MKTLPDFVPPSHWKPYSMQGQIWLETEYYLIVKGLFYNTFAAEECTDSVECEYDCAAYKVPLPKKYKSASHYNFKDDKIKGLLETLIDFDLRETNPKDEKRFTLPAFGIPEPELALKRLSRFRFTMTLLGGILMFFAFWRMYRTRREDVT